MNDAIAGRNDSATTPGLIARLKSWLKPATPEADAVREVIEGLIEERAEENPEGSATPIDPNERLLLGNVLKLRDVAAADIMIPRADIIAIDAELPMAEVFRSTVEQGHSRYPVYRSTLDDVIGLVHIKDLVQAMAKDVDAPAFEGAEDAAPTPKLGDLVRKVLFVSPAIRVLDLLLEMRIKRTHMALVVDEFGGIDGLVTIEDVVEQIVGEIEDEHDAEAEPEFVEQPDGTVLADGRLTLMNFEEKFGSVFSEDERAQSETLAGLVAHLAGRVPARNELIKHSSGMEFEVAEGDPRHVRRLRILKLPPRPAEQSPAAA